MRTLIIVPTYNEIENIKQLLDTVLEITPESVEAMVVDDGSPDGTGQLVDSMALENPRIHIIHREKKMGLGPSYKAGFRWGFENGFDVMIQMDADFSHNPKYLAKMLEFSPQYDVVIGSRYVSGGGTLNWGVSRRVLSKCGSLYSRLVLGAPFRDFTSGFIAWHRKVLETIGLDTLRADGYSFQIELKYRAFKAGFRIHEFPIVFEDRQVGNSKMSHKIILEALYRVWQFRFGPSGKKGQDHLSRVLP